MGSRKLPEGWVGLVTAARHVNVNPGAIKLWVDLGRLESLPRSVNGRLRHFVNLEEVVMVADELRPHRRRDKRKLAAHVAGLTPGQFFVLDLLDRAGPMTADLVAARRGIKGTSQHRLFREWGRLFEVVGETEEQRGEKRGTNPGQIPQGMSIWGISPYGRKVFAEALAEIDRRIESGLVPMHDVFGVESEAPDLAV